MFQSCELLIVDVSPFSVRDRDVLANLYARAWRCCEIPVHLFLNDKDQDTSGISMSDVGFVRHLLVEFRRCESVMLLTSSGRGYECISFVETNLTTHWGGTSSPAISPVFTIDPKYVFTYLT